MSIKLYTFFNTINYGTLLQSLCLKNFIENTTNIKIVYDKYQPKKLIFAEVYRPLITKNLFKLKNTLKKNYKIYKWKKIANQSLKRNYLNDIDDVKLSIYGSDEIWNFQNAYHKYDPHFFGSNNNSKKITYAVSIGRAKYDDLTEFQEMEIKKNLEKFDSISVRDQNTALLVKKMINFNPIIVVDPTLLYTPPILEDSSLVDYIEDKNYAAVYGNVFSEKQKKEINDFCNKNNLNLISVGYLNKWIKKNYIDLDPTGFFQLMKKSTFVFTSMFHGIMFSVKLQKQFYYVVDPIRENKINFFVNKLNLKEREIREKINNTKEINYEDVYKILNQWIDESKTFLIDSINKNYL